MILYIIKKSIYIDNNNTYIYNIKIHTSMASLVCEKCNQLFLTKQGLDYHTTKGVCAKIKNVC